MNLMRYFLKWIDELNIDNMLLTVGPPSQNSTTPRPIKLPCKLKKKEPFRTKTDMKMSWF